MCRSLEVSRAGYYKWLKHEKAEEEKENEILAQLIREYDKKMAASGDFALAVEANEALAAMARKQTVSILNDMVLMASQEMKNGYDRTDN